MSNDKLAHRIRVAIDCYHAATLARCNAFGNAAHYNALEAENAAADRLNELLQEFPHEAEKQAGPVAAVRVSRTGSVTQIDIDWNNDIRCSLLDGTKLYAAPPSESDKEDAELLALIDRLEGAASAALTQAHNAGKVAHKAGIYMPSIEASAGLAQAIIALRGFAASAKKEQR